MKKIFSTIKAILLIFLVLIIFSAAYLFIQSPGKAQPITDIKGSEIPESISTIEKWEIGG